MERRESAMVDERTTSAPTSASIPALFSDVLNQVTNLFRTEVRLAKTEISEKINQALVAAGFIIGGAVLLIGGLYLFLQFLVILLVALGLAPVWATLIVAVVTVAIGFFIVRKGIGDLSASQLVPNRTVQSLEKDAAVAKEQVR
jgi:uncharacterized membrane protein YqjE